MTISARPVASVTYLVSSLSVGDTFDITFPFGENDENLTVYYRTIDNDVAILVLDEDYQITYEDGTNDVYGVVELLKSFDNLLKLNISRNIPIDQAVNYSSQIVFSKTVEYSLDKLTMILQDNQFKEYTIHFPMDEDVTDGVGELAPRRLRSGKNAVWNEDGKLWFADDAGAIKALRQLESEDDDPNFAMDPVLRSNSILGFEPIDANGKCSPKYFHLSNGLQEINGNITAKSSQGIIVDENGISVDTGNGIEIQASKLNVLANLGIEVDETGVSAKAGAAITVDENGISVDYGDGLTLSGSDPTETKLTLKSATATTIGGIKIGAGFLLYQDGSMPRGELIIQQGNGIQVSSSNGVEVSINSNAGLRFDHGFLALAIATKSTIGGVIIRNHLNIDENGYLDAIPLGEEDLGRSLEFIDGKLEVKIAYGLEITTDGLVPLAGNGIVFKQINDDSNLPRMQMQLRKATKTDIGGVIVGDIFDVDGDGKIDLQLSNGLTKVENKLTIFRGPGLGFDGGKLVPILGPGVRFGSEIDHITLDLGKGIYINDMGKAEVNIGGGLTFDDNGKLEIFVDPNIDSGLEISKSNNTLCLRAASAENLGGIKVDGYGLRMLSSYIALKPASRTQIGGVIVEGNLIIDETGHLKGKEIYGKGPYINVQVLDDRYDIGFVPEALTELFGQEFHFENKKIKINYDDSITIRNNKLSVFSYPASGAGFYFDADGAFGINVDNDILIINNNAITAQKAKIVNLIYPVGSLYFARANDISQYPQTIFPYGWSWSKLDGASTAFVECWKRTA